MKPCGPSPNEFITLEGVDYNLLRDAESRAREKFGRPENREARRQHIRILFPKAGDAGVQLIAPEPAPSRELL
jgi:hypothetical protein